MDTGRHPLVWRRSRRHSGPGWMIAQRAPAKNLSAAADSQEPALIPSLTERAALTSIGGRSGILAAMDPATEGL